MQTVTDETGRRYLRIKTAGESSLVRDPETGEEQYLDNDRLTPVDRSPLETAAGELPAETRRLLTAVHDERGLGLVLELDRRGPLSVRALLSAYDLCESDLHGLLGELQAGGVIETTEVGGERGYRLAGGIGERLDALRAGGT
jgi:hypothetical protein